jgi:CRP-like cAMP-binding protein
MQKNEKTKQFNDYLSQYISLNEGEKDLFFDALTFKSFQKNEIILQQGMVCKYQFFILKGTFIASETDDEGNEHILQIGIENSWIGDLASFTYSTPSTRLIKAAIEGEILLLNQANYTRLLEQIPAIEILFQNAYIAQTQRVSLMLNTDVKKRFELFKIQNPHLIGRVEWKTIASYLDMAPETLSRIKNKAT